MVFVSHDSSAAFSAETISQSEPECLILIIKAQSSCADDTHSSVSLTDASHSHFSALSFALETNLRGIRKQLCIDEKPLK